MTPFRIRQPDKDYSYPYSQSENDKSNILIFGDSFSFGQGVRYKDIYSTKLQLLLAQNGYSRYKVTNVALNGSKHPRIVYNYYHALETQKNVKLVIYGFVITAFGIGMEKKYIYNLVDQNNAGNKYNVWRKKIALYNLLVSSWEKYQVSQKVVKGYLNAFFDIDSNYKFKEITYHAYNAHQVGAKFVMLIIPLMYQLNNKYPFYPIHHKIKDFCVKNNIACIDSMDILSKYETETLWASPTDHHPNEIAHNLIANELFKYLQKNGLLL
ncbi:MAG: SGNH/GDSL hydrolase family protein [Oligoflexia bacterium]|nr:SGNH/GDSL hydrolase family protein [Oligoflexia bacterium]